MANIIELDGKFFSPLDQHLLPEWPCVASQRPQPTLTLKDDDLFLIIDTLGNISACLNSPAEGSLGLFCQDTRFLSRLELQIDGYSPILLSSDARKGFALTVLCTNPRLPTVLPESIALEREIVLNNGLFEEITVTNYGTTIANFELSLSFAADFADLFEVRGHQREQRGELLHLVEPPLLPTETLEVAPHLTEIAIAYQGRDGSLMQSQIQFNYRLPDFLKGNTAIWSLQLDAHQTCKLGYRVQPLSSIRTATLQSSPNTLMQAKAAAVMEEQNWYQAVTRIRTDNKSLNQIIEQAERDIYLLRQRLPAGQTISAGVPWFSTLFGRDALITSSQALILDPTIAKETLHILAHYQGKEHNDWRDEQPGKILHELRVGELARCQEIPHTPYYGTIDATPLWLMLYAEYFAWSQDLETLNKLWPNALAAMDWIDQNLQEMGYLAYHRRSSRGLANQGWKDSENCIVDRHGQQPDGPIALCEVQAYVYAAKVRLSEIACMKKRIDLVERWQEQAEDLKNRFNRDFWMEEQGYCAMALDGAGRQIDGIASNPGHCLSSGILLPEYASSVAERLRAPDLFNGWGIRTLSSLSPAYNPMGYHIGSIWPHDNSLIMMGLRSLGLFDQALEIAQGIIDMTLTQPYQRPPELFCGYERHTENIPVGYPVACSPQAWATGTIFQLMHMMLNLVPDIASNSLRIIDPALPDSIQQVTLQNLRVGTTLLDLEFERSGEATACRVRKKRGNLRVIIEA